MNARRDRLRLLLLQAAGGTSMRLLPRADLASLPPRPRILLVRPDHLGDLLFTTPALRWLRGRLPEAHLAALVGPWGKAVLAGNPHLDQVRTLPFPGFARRPKGRPWAPYILLRRTAEELRPLHFDAAVVLRFDHWWGAWLARLAGIPRCVGYDVPSTRPFLTAPIPHQPGRHEVLQNLALARALLGEEGEDPAPEEAPLEFPIPPAAARQAEALLGSDRRPICIHPGAGAPVKLWPAERWAHVADALVEVTGEKIAITGGPEELDLARRVEAHMQGEARVLAGETSLSELAAIFARARLVLGPDCGPLKLAQAVGARTVHLYGPVDVRAFGPWGNPAAYRVVESPLPCVPCNRLDYRPEELPDHPCMDAIDVEAVLAMARELL